MKISLETLHLAGLSDAVILRLIELETKERNAKVRDQNRIRQQNQRMRNGVKRDGVTESRRDVRDMRDMRDLGESLSLRESVKEESKKEVAVTRKQDRGRTCPPDFSASDSHYKEGENLGLSRTAVDQLCDDMKTWAQANRNRAVARKADWGLTFLGWMRRAKPRPAEPPANDGKPQWLADAEEKLRAERRAKNGKDNEQDLFPRSGEVHGEPNQKPKGDEVSGHRSRL